MNRGIYMGASGMQGLQHWLDIEANNLANANTTGYKADSLMFRDSLEKELYANGGTGAAVGTLGNGPMPGEEYTDYSTGPIQTTGNPLDVAIDAPTSMFAVKTPNGLRYTRDGSFTLNTDRQLVTQSGNLVLDSDGQTITLPSGTPEISTSGEITVNTSTGTQDVAKLGLVDGQWQKDGLNLCLGQNVKQVPNVSLVPESLEGSNVNAVLAMTNLIKIQRSYELAQKSITTEDQSSQQLIGAMNA